MSKSSAKQGFRLSRIKMCMQNLRVRQIITETQNRLHVIASAAKQSKKTECRLKLKDWSHLWDPHRLDKSSPLHSTSYLVPSSESKGIA